MRWNKAAALLVLVLGGSSSIGCGNETTPPIISSNQGGNGGAGGEGGGGDSCNHSCPAFGATQCSGDTLQSCAPNADGCRQWISLLDCAVNGSVCNDSVMPAACVALTCSDEAKNQDETDVDCGGTKCNKCDFGKACSQDTDCTTNLCDPMSKTCTCPPLNLTEYEADGTMVDLAIDAFHAGIHDSNTFDLYFWPGSMSARLYSSTTCVQQPPTLQAAVEALGFNFAYGNPLTTAELQAHNLFTTWYSTGGPGLKQAVAVQLDTTTLQGWEMSYGPGQSDEFENGMVLLGPTGNVVWLEYITGWP